MFRVVVADGLVTGEPRAETLSPESSTRIM
jgi:hypothetical protein